ncbi:hypothetical protein [Pantoea sp.]|uniref:hypothetical protein n=1 Tax=Pantoea sp. TaxID=69393 RepID=UPI0028A1FB7B|nr:hypothetical protein [Pantoea sp.]
MANGQSAADKTLFCGATTLFIKTRQPSNKMPDSGEAKSILTLLSDRKKWRCAEKLTEHSQICQSKITKMLPVSLLSRL